MGKWTKRFSFVLAPALLASMLASAAAAAAAAKETNQVQMGQSSYPFAIAPQFDDISEFGTDVDGLAMVKMNGKWGLIDKTGKFRVELKYDSQKWSNANSRFVQVNDKWGLIDLEGNYLAEPKYDVIAGYNSTGFHEGLAPVSIDGLWGYIDETGKEVIAPKYAAASAFEGGIALVSDKDFDASFIDQTGKVVAEMPEGLGYAWDIEGSIFNEGLLWVIGDEKAGVIDPKTGRIVLKPEYDSPWREEAGPNRFHDGLTLVAKNGKKLIVNRSGDVLSDLPAYQDAAYTYTTGFNEGLAALSVDGKYGYIDTAGKEIVAPKYDQTYNFSNGMSRVQLDDKWGFIDKTGQEVIPLSYDMVGDFSPEGLAFAVKDDKYGYIRKSGDIVIPFAYDNASPFYGGYATVQKGEMWGLIDATGHVVLEPQFESIYFFGNREDFTLEGVTNFDRTFFPGGMLAVKANGKIGFLTQSQLGISSGTAPTAPVNPATPAKASAVPTASKVLVNGKEVAFEAYNIDGNNFFKLRDLAAALNGTAKGFEVGWDADKNAISLQSAKPYTPVGGELAVSGGNAAKTAVATSSKLYVDSLEEKMTAYNIDGSNYFKLRDIAGAFNFGVAWNADANAIEVSTAAGYTAE